MKRLGNLYDQICSIENLRLADEKARRRKLRSYGVQRHDKNRDENLLRLQEMLLTQTYKTSQYDVFTIYEPKERQIFRLPYFPDRITHHAIMNVLEPIWVSVFTNDTYSCIKNRGIHAGRPDESPRETGRGPQNPHPFHRGSRQSPRVRKKRREFAP